MNSLFDKLFKTPSTFWTFLSFVIVVFYFAYTYFYRNSFNYFISIALIMVWFLILFNYFKYTTAQLKRVSQERLQAYQYLEDYGQLPPDLSEKDEFYNSSKSEYSLEESPPEKEYPKSLIGQLKNKRLK